MKRIWTERTRWTALAVALVAAGAQAAPATAQDMGAGDPITIVIPSLAPQNGANDNFGDDVAEELRDLINNLHTHQAITGRNLTRVRRAADVAHEELFNCLNVRQLAMWVNREQASGREIRGANQGERWGLVLCGQYEEIGDRQVRVNARFVGSEDGAEFRVPEFTASEREPDEAAQRILETFDAWQNQLRHTVFCQQYMQSESWDRALENCDRALEINPQSVTALYNRALILRELERQGEALQAIDRILEIDPLHENALKTGGIVATEANMPDEAREYLDQYMELNPGDVVIRLTIARDIFNAGDPVVAMEFAQEGLEVNPDDMTLVTYIGHMAAEAARRAEAALSGQQEPSGSITADPAQVTEYYQIAADSYQRVYEAQRLEAEIGVLERLIVSQFKLGNYDRAVELGRTITSEVDQLPEEAAGEDTRTATAAEKGRIWNAYSRALQEAGEAEEALAAIERAQELGDESLSLVQRKALLQLQLGQESEAVAALVEGVESGRMQPAQAFRIVFANAYNEKFHKGQLDAAYSLLDAAGPLAQTEQDRLARNFWRGYIRFEQGKAAHEPMTAASASQAKPLFERAIELFQQSQGYEQYHPSANVPDLLQNARQFLEIQERLIERGR